MPAKWTTVLSLTFLVVVLALATANRAEACSGDDCGCSIEFDACRAACPPVGQPGHTECMADCRHENILCSKCCCCECWNCRGCGVVVITELPAPSDGPELVIATLLDAANRCAPASRGDELFVDQCR